MYECKDCGEQVEEGGLPLLKHLREYHNADKNLNIVCPGCNVVKKTFPSFQKHWYGSHHVSKKNKASASATHCEDTASGSANEGSLASSGPTGSETLGVCSVISNVPSISVENSAVKKARVELCESETLQAPVKSTSSENVAASGSEGSQKESEFSSESNVMDCLEEIDSVSRVAVTVCEASSAMEPEGILEENEENSSSLVGQDGDEYGDIVIDCGSVSGSSVSSESEESDGEVLEEGVVPCITQINSSSVSQIHNVNENAASFILHLKEKCNVPIKNTSKVIVQTEKLIKGALENFACKVDNTLKNNNMSLNNFVNVKDAIETTSKEVFNNLRSDHLQNKYFKEKLGLIEPARYPLGRVFRRVRRKHKTARQTVISQEELIYIPADKLMDKLVGHPDYKRFVEEGSISGNSDVLDSYMKGEKCKKNPVLQEHPDALRFVLYYDDLEVCSPLKSKAGKHKLGAFYLHLDNIPLKYRSNLDLICVVGLVNANLVKGKNYGMDAALEHLVDTLKKFEDGVILRNGKKVYGTLIATIGDNLGAHAIGGFKEGFTAHRMCRFCSATHAEAKKMTKEDISLLRNKETHSRQCDKVQTTRGKNEPLSKEYGVNRDSLLNQLKSYHVIEGLPPDLLHDITEGSLSLTVKKFLNHHLYDAEAEERKFTLDWLNAAIRDFDYGHSEVSDKPSELKKDYITDNESPSLHQSGCQLWLLATILPLIVGPLIDVDDKYFQNLLDILEISRIVFSTEISKWMVLYLEDLIELYLSNYISLYGPLIPKQHYLIHYPRLILLLGPLVNFSCTRSEAKHKYFKKIVNILGNYKHVPWTLSKRHQLTQGVAWNKSLFKEPKVGPFSWVYTSDVSYGSLLSPRPPKVLEAAWLEFNGVKVVKEKSFICVGSNDSIPLFVKVMKVLVFPACQLVCQKVFTRMKNVHLAAYEIDLLSEYCITNLKDMILPKVFHAHRVCDKDFIVMKQCTADALF